MVRMTKQGEEVEKKKRKICIDPFLKRIFILIKYGILRLIKCFGKFYNLIIKEFDYHMAFCFYKYRILFLSLKHYRIIWLTHYQYCFDERNSHVSTIKM